MTAARRQGIGGLLGHREAVDGGHGVDRRRLGGPPERGVVEGPGWIRSAGPRDRRSPEGDRQDHEHADEDL